MKCKECNGHGGWFAAGASVWTKCTGCQGTGDRTEETEEGPWNIDGRLVERARTNGHGIVIVDSKTPDDGKPLLVLVIVGDAVEKFKRAATPILPGVWGK